MLAWTLNTKAEQGSSSAGGARAVDVGSEVRGAGARSTIGVEDDGGRRSWSAPIRRTPGSTRRRGTTSGSTSASIAARSSASPPVHLVPGRSPRRPSGCVRHGTSAPPGAICRAAGGAGEACEHAAAACRITPRRVAMSCRPATSAGVGRRPICSSIWSSSSSGSHAPADRSLLRKVRTGRLARPTHLEQLERLGFDALRRCRAPSRPRRPPRARGRCLRRSRGDLACRGG